MADEIMKKGWVSIRESERIQPLQAIKLLESEVEVQKSVLDKVNIILIQTTWQLVRNYDYISKHKRGICHLKSLGETGMNAFFSYSTPKDIVEIISILRRCFSEVGLRDKADTFSDLILGFFPKAPSSDSIRMAGVSHSFIEQFKEDYFQLVTQTKGRVQVQQIVSYIFKLCDLIV